MTETQTETKKNLVTVDQRILKVAWWVMKDRRDWLIHGEPPTAWTDKIGAAKDIQKYMDLIEAHSDER